MKRAAFPIALIAISLLFLHLYTSKSTTTSLTYASMPGCNKSLMCYVTNVSAIPPIHNLPSKLPAPADTITPTTTITTTTAIITSTGTAKLSTSQASLESSTQSPGRAIYLLKTHKTGGSAIQNIILRQTLLRNLSIGISSSGGDWSRLCIDRLITKDCICNIDDIPLDVLAHHMRFQRSEVTALMKKDAKFVSILRDPMEVIVSGYSYFDWMKNYRSFDVFLKSTAKSRGISGVLLPYRNIMMYAFGLQPTEFDNDDKISSKLTEIESTFDLILINSKEYFNQSLILLKDLMGWSIDDVVVIAVNKQIKSRPKPVLTKTMEKTLLGANRADQMLYEKFLRIFKQKLDNFGKERMKEEVKILIKRTEELKEKCIAGTKPGRSGTLEYVLKPEAKDNLYCKYMATAEMELTSVLFKRQRSSGGRRCPGGL